MKAAIGLVQYESSVHAWTLDPPGAIVGGHDLAAVECQLPVVLAEHVAWLRTHGEAVESLDSWSVVETIDVRLPDVTGGEFCFKAERQPMSLADTETLIRRIEYARADLSDAYRALPDEILDWEPPLSSQRIVDAWAPEARTIRGVLEHVLQLEVYYRDGLRDGTAKGIFERVGDPADERKRTLEVLRALSDSERSRVYHPVRPGRLAGEEWTVRKFFRRVISHERAHAAEILQRRTWLLLGVPGSA